MMKSIYSYPMKTLRHILITALFLSSFSLSAQGAGKDSILVGILKGPTGICMEKLAEKPLVLADGRKVECVILPSVDLMVARMARGELALAALPSNTAAIIHRGGMGYVLAAVTGKGMLSFITRDSSIRSVAGLRGKEIQVSGQGAVPEYVFRTILAARGLDPAKDLKLLFGMPYPEIASSLIAGRIDSALLPEPFATMALAGNKELQRPFDVQAEYASAGGAKDYPLSVLVIRKGFLTDDPEAARSILKAVEESIAWVKANPQEAGALAERLEFGLKASVAAASIPKANYVFETAKAAKPEIEALYRRFLAFAPESLGGSLPGEDFYAY
jgi:NitT/TauT family transport system substrate-binding protein